MGRPECSIDFENGEIAQFADELRCLRERSGKPSYRKLAQATHYSASTLAAAASGRQLPSLQVTLALVTACGGDPEEWAARWRRAEQTVKGTGQDPARRTRSRFTGWAARSRWPELRGHYSQAGASALAAAVLCLAGLAVSKVLPWHAAAATVTTHRPIDGRDPYIAGCGGDQQVLDRRTILWPDGKPYGSLVLLHSEGCRASWGYVYGPNSPKWAISIVARRIADGASAPSSFQGPARPNSWGNMLSTQRGCVYVQAFLTVGKSRSRPAQTSCFQDAGPVVVSRGP